MTRRQLLSLPVPLLMGGPRSLRAQDVMVTGKPHGTPPPTGIQYVTGSGVDLGNNNSSTSVYTPNLTITAPNQMAVLGIAGDISSSPGDGDSITTVKAVKGGSLTAMDLVIKLDPGPGTGGRWIYQYTIYNPDVGTHALEISSSHDIYLIACAGLWQNMNATQGTQVTASNTTPGTSPITSVSLTTTTDNSLIVMVGGGFNVAFAGPYDIPTADTGAVLRAADQTYGAVGLYDSGSIIHPAGSYTLGWKYSSPTPGNPLMSIAAAYIP